MFYTGYIACINLTPITENDYVIGPVIECLLLKKTMKKKKRRRVGWGEVDDDGEKKNGL